MLKMHRVMLATALLGGLALAAQVRAQEPQPAQNTAAQDPAAQPPASTQAAEAGEGKVVAPAPNNPEGTEAQAAEVVEVRGNVERSTGEAATPDTAEWVAVKAGEKLGGGVLIRTGLRSHLILRFGDNSIVMIQRCTLASIKQFYRDSSTETVRLGLGYGAIRGGTSEGTLRSDFVVDSAVATLAKRGTEGWELWQEPYSGRFRISLAAEGLVDALEKETGDRRLVRPGEYADNTNVAAMWVKQDVFDRNVQFFAAESVSATDLDFANNMTTGLASVGPGLGNQTNSFAGRGTDQDALAGLTEAEGFQLLREPVVIERAPFVVRPEGNFGTGASFAGDDGASFVSKSRIRSYAHPRYRARWSGSGTRLR